MPLTTYLFVAMPLSLTKIPLENPGRGGGWGLVHYIILPMSTMAAFWGRGSSLMPGVLQMLTKLQTSLQLEKVTCKNIGCWFTVSKILTFTNSKISRDLVVSSGLGVPENPRLV